MGKQKFPTLDVSCLLNLMFLRNLNNQSWSEALYLFNNMNNPVIKRK